MITHLLKNVVSLLKWTHLLPISLSDFLGQSSHLGNDGVDDGDGDGDDDGDGDGDDDDDDDGDDNGDDDGDGDLYIIGAVCVSVCLSQK